MGITALGPIGQIAREVKDIRAAEHFFKEVLRLPHLYTFGDLVFFACGDTRLFLAPPEHGEPGRQSILYFKVDDLSTSCRELSERGVAFEGAPQLIHRHGDGTEEWMAFFRDPDGNFLALMQQVKPKA